jgi:Immunoglobulin domain
MTIPRKNTLLCAILTIFLATLLIQGAAFAGALTFGREKLKGTSKTQGDFNLQNRFSLEIDGVSVGPGAAAHAVSAGASVTIAAPTSGSPAPTFQWQKNGVNIAGATGASYTISNVKSSDAATYTVVATTAAGPVISAGAVLTVKSATSAPVFTVQPRSRSTPDGSSVTFTAAASGSPKPAYQWKKNGVGISEANSASYTISRVSANDAGTYTVVAANAAGSATSAGAVLKVLVLSK